LQLPATNESWQPWVLSSYPDKDSLALPAFRGRDSLNTTEQITLDNPVPGTYVVRVKGSQIQTSSSQSFALAYQLDTVNKFNWTYPNSTDVLMADRTNVIRWQTNIAGTGSLEYSADGIQWQTIGSSVDLSRNYFKWNAPDSNTTAFLRMNLPSSSAVVSNNFVISEPMHIDVGFDCPDSFLLYWNKFKTDQYQLYRLGQKYLEPVQVVSDSFVVFKKSQHPELFYSVAPLLNGRPGWRSFTINYTTQGVGCYVKTFFALLQNNNTALLTTELGTLYNVQEVAFQKLGSSGFQTIKTFFNPSALDLAFTDLQLTQGANLYRAQVQLNDGTIVYSNTDLAYFFPGQPVIIYPNPARQNQSINIIARDPGIYSIDLFDVNGKLAHQQKLVTISQRMENLRLSAGLYFVRITDDQGKAFVQKLIVY